jgi:hypothetical protein
VKIWFQAFAFKCNLYRYKTVSEFFAARAPAIVAAIDPAGVSSASSPGAAVAGAHVAYAALFAMYTVGWRTTLIQWTRIFESAWFQPSTLEPEM